MTMEENDISFPQPESEEPTIAEPAGEEPDLQKWGREPLTTRNGTARSAPFATLTWRDWKQTQAQIELCLHRFVDAAEQKQAHRVVAIGLEMIEVVNKILLEAYALGVNEQLDLKQIPGGHELTIKRKQK
jgi:hypothetical protein